MPSRAAAGLLVLAALWFAGCATPPAERYTLFFPDPPAPPRFQYLYRFQGEEEIRPRSRFEEFVVGETRSRRFGKPYGVFYRDGKIYVCDPGLGALIILDLDRREFRPVFNRGEGMLAKPIGVAVADDGIIYVADSKREQIVRFGPDEKYIGAWSGRGDFRPAGLAIRGDQLYVADVRGHYVHVLDRHTGEVLRSIGGPRPQGMEDAPPGYLVAPTNVAVDDGGNLYVADSIQGRVLHYDPEGRFLGFIGRLGNTVGSFARPRGVAIDQGHRLLVVDAAFENVQLFDDQGRTLMFFGGPGPQPGQMWLPSGIFANAPVHDFFKPFIDERFVAESLVIVANQYGPANISVYAFGYSKENPPVYPDPEATHKGGGEEGAGKAE